MLIQQLNVPASVLGEGPVWSHRDGCLYFVDIVSHKLFHPRKGVDALEELCVLEGDRPPAHYKDRRGAAARSPGGRAAGHRAR